MTPSGIEPATFRVVAQCLIQLRHRDGMLYGELYFQINANPPVSTFFLSRLKLYSFIYLRIFCLYFYIGSFCFTILLRFLPSSKYVP